MYRIWGVAIANIERAIQTRYLHIDYLNVSHRTNTHPHTHNLKVQQIPTDNLGHGKCAFTS